MYRTTISFDNKINAGKNPVLYTVINTDFGARAYLEKNIPILKFGTYIDIQARLLSISGLISTTLPDRYDILTGYQTKKQDVITIVLSNVDNYFSRMIGKEPFLTKQVQIKYGFLNENISNHSQKFAGTVDEIEDTEEELTLQVVEL